MSLFEDDENLEFTFNTKFVEEYERKKKREELSNLQEKYKGIDDKKARKLADLKRKYGKDVDVTDALDDDDEHATRDAGSDDSDASSSEEEDEVGELVTPEVDAQILKTLTMIRKRDPAVYQPDTQFFSPAMLEKTQAEWKAKQRELKQQAKKVTLKDLEREQVLRGITDVEAAGEQELAAIRGELSHVEQLAKVKEEFKSAAFGDDGAAAGAGSDDDDDDGLFTSIVKSDEMLAKEEEDYKSFLLESMAKAGGEGYLEVWQQHTGQDEEPKDANEQFLIDFVLNRGWIDKEDKKQGPALWEGDAAHPVVPEVDTDEDEATLDAIDSFEHKYNFRFEEAGALGTEVGITTHARTVPESVRRKEDKRKREREARKARKEAEKMQKQEELKRLKNLKRDEVLAKLREIKEITGNDEVGFDEVDLEAEFDPDQWDQKMTTVFDDSFYAAEDAGMKPEWDDDIDIDDLVAPEDKASMAEAAAAARAAAAAPPAPVAAVDDTESKNKKKKKKRKKFDDDDEDDFIEVPDADAMDAEPVVAAPASRKQQQQQAAATAAAPAPAAASKRAVSAEEQAALDDLYKLDYEDIVGGIPVRFRYREVRPASYGLSVEDIFEADDADLNQYVSLKKLAPFREPEREERDLKKYSGKHRVNEFRKKLQEKKRALLSGVSAYQDQQQSGSNSAEDRLAAYQPTTKRNSKKRRKNDE
ncbi:Kinetochore protein Spc24 [Blastocladiella emersonii ATCC 22665]|nr:Kinetochore protein Spc24 [Blastocladiella emersonii ATCC 22665]